MMATGYAAEELQPAVMPLMVAPVVGSVIEFAVTLSYFLESDREWHGR